MGHDVEYHKDKDQKKHENTNHVQYETCREKQKFVKENILKEVQDKCHTRFVAGNGVHGLHASRDDHRSHKSVSSSSSRHKQSELSSHTRRRSHSPSAHHRSSSGHPTTKKSISSTGCSSKRSRSSKPKSLEERAMHCYAITRLARKGECNKKRIWQLGEFVKDECGEGIEPKRYNFMPSRKIWCKTPLTMYQATIGDLGRKILCRETIVPRDVKPGGPCNICEFILPPCRGYYRKYDCLRPCEEEYAIKKGGQKQYRNRVERYWEPCQSKFQKHKLDINDYAPHNVYLGIKMRRKNGNEHCW